MAYPYYTQYQPSYYPASVPDQLAQLRQNQFQPMQQPQQFQQNPPVPSIVWVQSEQDALNYLVAPNSAVTLWDSNVPVVYLKQADASGKPSMKVYDLVERDSRPVQAVTAQTVEYAPLYRLEALEAKLSALEAIKTQSAKATIKKQSQKEDAE